MSSKRSGKGDKELYQSSLFRYTKPTRLNSAQTAPSRTPNSRFKDEIASTSSLIEAGITRVYTPTRPHPTARHQLSGLSSSRREVKENKVPPPGTLLGSTSSSPISGLGTPCDRILLRREKRIGVETNPTFPKRIEAE